MENITKNIPENITKNVTIPLKIPSWRRLKDLQAAGYANRVILEAGISVCEKQEGETNEN